MPGKLSAPASACARRAARSKRGGQSHRRLTMARRSSSRRYHEDGQSIASRSVAAVQPVRRRRAATPWLRYGCAVRHGAMAAARSIGLSALSSAQRPLPAQGIERPYCPVAAAAAAAARRRSGIAHQLVKIALLDAVLRDGGDGCDSDRPQHHFAESTHSIVNAAAPSRHRLIPSVGRELSGLAAGCARRRTAVGGSDSEVP